MDGLGLFGEMTFFSWLNIIRSDLVRFWYFGIVLREGRWKQDYVPLIWEQWLYSSSNLCIRNTWKRNRASIYLLLLIPHFLQLVFPPISTKLAGSSPTGPMGLTDKWVMNSGTQHLWRGWDIAGEMYSLFTIFVLILWLLIPSTELLVLTKSSVWLGRPCIKLFPSSIWTCNVLPGSGIDSSIEDGINFSSGQHKSWILKLLLTNLNYHCSQWL